MTVSSSLQVQSFWEDDFFNLPASTMSLDVPERVSAHASSSMAKPVLLRELSDLPWVNKSVTLASPGPVGRRAFADLNAATPLRRQLSWDSPIRVADDEEDFSDSSFDSSPSMDLERANSLSLQEEKDNLSMPGELFWSSTTMESYGGSTNVFDLGDESQDPLFDFSDEMGDLNEMGAESRQQHFQFEVDQLPTVNASMSKPPVSMVEMRPRSWTQSIHATIVDPTPARVRQKATSRSRARTTQTLTVRRGRARVADTVVKVDAIKEINISLRALSDMPSNLHMTSRALEDRVTCGTYSKATRREKIQRFRAKWQHQRTHIKYDCRKQFADRRPRIGGRFVKIHENKLGL